MKTNLKQTIFIILCMGILTTPVMGEIITPEPVIEWHNVTGVIRSNDPVIPTNAPLSIIMKFRIDDRLNSTSRWNTFFERTGIWSLESVPIVGEIPGTPYKHPELTGRLDFEVDQAPYAYTDSYSHILTPAGQTNHIVITWDGINAKFYVNGTLFETIPANYPPGDGTAPSSNYSFNGTVEYAKVYNTILTDEYIMADYINNSNIIVTPTPTPEPTIIVTPAPTITFTATPTPIPTVTSTPILITPTPTPISTQYSLVKVGTLSNYYVELVTSIKNVKVLFYVDGKLYRTESIGRYCLFGGDICSPSSLSPGNHIIEAKTYDRATNTLLDTRSITIGLIVPTPTPIVTASPIPSPSPSPTPIITSTPIPTPIPTPTSKYSLVKVGTISKYYVELVSPTKNIKVVFYVDGVTYRTETISRYCLFGGDVCAPSTLPSGQHTIMAKIYDKYTNKLLDIKTITI